MNDSTNQPRECRTVAWAIVCLFVLAVPSAGLGFGGRSEPEGHAHSELRHEGVEAASAVVRRWQIPMPSAARSAALETFLPSRRPFARPPARAPSAC